MKLKYENAVILITGASSGLGKEFSRELAREAKALILVARRTERLQILKEELLKINPKVLVAVISCDLSKLTNIDEMLLKIKKNFPVVDILINNAGFGDMSLLEKADWAKLESMIQTNITAPVYLAHKLVGAMIEQKSGGILNVGSSGGIHFMPSFATYTGTKYFINGFTESLRADLEGTGVYVGQLCPGPVSTEFEQVAAQNYPMKVPSLILLSAEVCVRFAIRESKNGRAMIVPGYLMKIMVAFYLYVPLFIRRFLGGQLGRIARKNMT